jgi:hypothetical protein
MVTFLKRIAASYDDDECWGIGRTNHSVISERIKFGLYYSPPTRGALRWLMDIPIGATIIAARLRVICRQKVEGRQHGFFTAGIRLLDYDDCPAFDFFNPYDSPTVGVVAWPITEEWFDETEYVSPDISSLVQAYINRVGYTPGSYIGIMIDEGDSIDTYPPQARYFFSYDSPENGPAKAAILEVEYTVGPPVPATLHILPAEGGTTEPPPGDYSYYIGATVTVKAIPAEGYSFSHWIADAATYTDNPLVFIMREEVTLQPVFTTRPPPSCFIATAAYGSPLAPQLSVLRRFRDSCLPNKIIQAYYRVSPPLANVIAKHDMLKTLVRAALKPIIQLLKK